MWKITPLFAEWLCAPRNPLFATGVLSAESAVLELGCGVSAILGLVLAPRVARYVLTDQPYVARFVEQNIAANYHDHHHHHPHHHPPDRSRAGKARKAKGGGASSPSSSSAAAAAAAAETDQHLRFAPLDWERDAVTASLAGAADDARRGFDVVVACDCIYNDALIDPLVSTCADVCRLGRQPPDGVVDDPPPCVCVVGQQLRDSDIFEQWLVRFARDFRVWRVPDALLTEGLRSDSGFVVHVGILRNLGGEDAIKDIGYRALLH